jgi:hypothetical protein
VHPGHEQIDRPLARRETLTHETAAYAHERIHVTLGVGHIHVTLGVGHIHVTLGAGRPQRPLESPPSSMPFTSASTSVTIAHPGTLAEPSPQRAGYRLHMASPS